MFLVSLAAVTSLGVIAGGSFWTAQSMYRITDNQHKVRTHLCSNTVGNSMGLDACP